MGSARVGRIVPRIVPNGWFASGAGGRRHGDRIARATPSKGSDGKSISLETLRRENEALQASISEAEQQVDELEQQIDSRAASATPAAGSPAKASAGAGEAPPGPCRGIAQAIGIIMSLAALSVFHRPRLLAPWHCQLQIFMSHASSTRGVLARCCDRRIH